MILVWALGTALIDPASSRPEKWQDALSIVVASLLGYAVARVLTWLVLRLLLAATPRLVRISALAGFYGALPFLLLVLFIGSLALHDPRPSPATIAFVIAAGASIAAGAYPAIRATDRLANAPSGHDA